MPKATGVTKVLSETERALPDQAQQMTLDGMPEPAKPRGPGRPPGRRNLRTENVAAFIRETIGDPLLELARMAMEPTAAKADRLGITRADAEVEKRLALVAVLPFTDQRQAIAVDMTNRNIVHLTIADQLTSDDGDARAPIIRGDLAELVEYQEVSGEALDVTDNDQSDDGD